MPLRTFSLRKKIQIHKLRNQFNLLIRDGQAIKLNLWAGNVVLSDYINIDIRALPGIDLISNISDLNFIHSETVDQIYTSHALEHVSHQSVLQVIEEWYRILKPGRKLLLWVPDFDKIVHVYTETNNNIWNIKSPLMGEQDYPYNTHYSVYNFEYLEEILKKVGFTNVRMLKESEMVTDQDWSFKKLFVSKDQLFDISLNVIAAK